MCMCGCSCPFDACEAAPPPPPPSVNCTGSWSACTMACEVAPDRVWAETSAREGQGAACPESRDCAPGEDDCPVPPPPPFDGPPCRSYEIATAARLVTDGFRCEVAMFLNLVSAHRDPDLVLWNVTTGRCAPADVAAPPLEAVGGQHGGIRSKVLHEGSGTIHPSSTDRVRVSYAGWTPDGQMFDSSAEHGGPQTFPVRLELP
jgi:hypothetical protein